jgi:hypothetical protein
MKPGLIIALPFLAFLLAFQNAEQPSAPSPLSEFSSEWNDPKYLVCNTAASANYLSEEEKKVIYILNLLHANPKLFGSTVVTRYPEYAKRLHLKNIDEYKSLLDTLQKVRSLPLLYPDSLCFESARCHAISSGQAAYVGHERKTDECKRKKRHQGECCQYGYKDALSILMALLIDENVPSLGHRFLCLSSYGRIGVSIQPHNGYGTNTVIDFYF